MRSRISNRSARARRVLSLLANGVLAFALGACGGGGGGGGDEGGGAEASPGGVGTGADGVTVFWYPYDTNVAVGAALSIEQTSDGGFVAAGFQANDFSSRRDVYVQKTDDKGARLWQRRIALGTDALAHGVRQTADDGYVVVGTATVAAGNTDLFLLKLDASGNTLWGPKTYGGPGLDEGYAVLPISDGVADSYIVAGQFDASGNNVNIYVLRVDANGGKLWDRSDYASLCGGFNASARAIVATSGGNFAVGGVTGCVSGSGVLLKISGADGSQLWQHAYDTSMSNTARVESVAVAPDGGFVLAGSVAPLSGNQPVAGKSDASIIKTDADGKEVWRRTFGGSENDEAYSVVAAADNTYLLAGYSQSYGGTVDPAFPFQWEDVFLIKLNSSGGTLWRKVKGNRPMASDRAAAVALAADGGFAVGGSSGGNVLVAKFDKNGDTLNLGATDLTYTVPANPGIITPGNAVDVAAAAVGGLLNPRLIGGTALDLLITAAAGAPASGFCSAGGSYAFDPAPPASLTAGSSYVLTFTNCVTGEGTTLDGRATLAIDALTGILGSASYTVQITLTDIDLTAADASLSTQTTGGMLYSRSVASGALTEVSSSSAKTLTLAESGGAANHTVAIGPFSVRSSVAQDGTVSIGEITGTPDTLKIEGDGTPFAVTVLQPLQAASATAAPTAGSFSVSADDNSRVTATVTNTNGDVSLAVDTDADGTVDGTVSVPWDFLD